MKSAFGYMGGKTRVASQIMKYMKDHKIYVEPFFGSGAVFFEKGYKNVSNSGNYREVIGDLDCNITNFFEQLRENAQEMEERLSLFEYSERLHQKCKTNSDSFKNASDLDRACMFFFNVCSSFGSNVGSGFAYSKKGQNDCKTFHKKRQELLKYTDRFADCFIFNKSYDVLIDKFDSEDTLFYFDPPYLNTRKYSIQKEHAFDYEKFAEKLKSIKGSWVLSHYRDAWLEETFEGYAFIDLKHSATICKSNGEERKGKDVKECIVLNYDPSQVDVWTGHEIAPQTKNLF